MPNDVYFQIGLLTTLGLTTKNAILIVQFAKTRVEEGMGLIEATLEAAKLRLRPIIMTSLAFGFGVLPLAIATGAGAGAQKAIGTACAGRHGDLHLPGDADLRSAVLRADLQALRQEATPGGGRRGSARISYRIAESAGVL